MLVLLNLYYNNYLQNAKIKLKVFIMLVKTKIIKINKAFKEYHYSAKINRKQTRDSSTTRNRAKIENIFAGSLKNIKIREIRPILTNF